MSEAIAGGSNGDDGPRGPFEYRIQRDMDRLRGDHESLKRENEQRNTRDDAHFDKLDRDYAAVAPAPSDILRLTTSIDRLSAKLDNIVAAAGTTRHNDWQTAIQVVGVVVALIAAVIAGTHLGVHP